MFPGNQYCRKCGANLKCSLCGGSGEQKEFFPEPDGKFCCGQFRFENYCPRCGRTLKPLHEPPKRKKKCLACNGTGEIFHDCGFWMCGCLWMQEPDGKDRDIGERIWPKQEGDRIIDTPYRREKVGLDDVSNIQWYREDKFLTIPQVSGWGRQSQSQKASVSVRFSSQDLGWG